MNLAIHPFYLAYLANGCEVKQKAHRTKSMRFLDFLPSSEG